MNFKQLNKKLQKNILKNWSKKHNRTIKEWKLVNGVGGTDIIIIGIDHNIKLNFTAYMRSSNLL